MTLDPHRVYIEFLASRYPEESSAARVLAALELPTPLPGSYPRIRSLILDKAPTNVRLFLNGRGSLPTMQPLWEWCCQQRFGVFWAQEPALRFNHHIDQPVYDAAWALLRNVPIRNTIDAVLLQQWGLRHSFDIERCNDILNTRFGETVQEPVFEMYRSFFFNPTRVAKANWLHYLDECSATRKEMLLLAMKGSDEQRFRHDLGAPPRFQFTSLLSDVMATSFYRFKAADAKDDPKLMVAMAKLMMDAGERREKHGQKDLADLRRDLQLGFDFLEADFPSLEEVEAGHLDRALGRRDSDE